MLMGRQSLVKERIKDPKKREAWIDILAPHFLEKGIREVPLDEVVLLLEKSKIKDLRGEGKKKSKKEFAPAAEKDAKFSLGKTKVYELLKKNSLFKSIGSGRYEKLW